MKTRVIAGLVVIAALAPGQASRPVGAVLDDDLAAKLPRMRVLMREGLDRERAAKPDSRSTTRPNASVFRGSYDRHSNIAAHWALLSWARRTSEADETKALLGRLGPAALEAERDFVAASHANPYADAWLLLLLREIGRASDDPRVLAICRDLAEQTEARLVRYVADCPAPRLPEAESGPESRVPRAPRSSRWTSGAYDSPLWALLALQLAPPASAERRKEVDRLRADRVLALRALPQREGRPLADFLWVDSMLWLSDALAADPAAPLPEYALPDHVPPRTRITLGNCHSLGCEIVKLWPLAWKTGAGDAAARKAFNDRLRLCLDREDAWDGPFVTVSHWVPQFVYFAVWLAEGRP